MIRKLAVLMSVLSVLVFVLILGCDDMHTDASLKRGFENASFVVGVMITQDELDRPGFDVGESSRPDPQGRNDFWAEATYEDMNGWPVGIGGLKVTGEFLQRTARNNDSNGQLVKSTNHSITSGTTGRDGLSKHYATHSPLGFAPLENATPNWSYTEAGFGRLSVGYKSYKICREFYSQFGQWSYYMDRAPDFYTQHTREVEMQGIFYSSYGVASSGKRRFFGCTPPEAIASPYDMKYPGLSIEEQEFIDDSSKGSGKFKIESKSWMRLVAGNIGRESEVFLIPPHDDPNLAENATLYFVSMHISGDPADLSGLEAGGYLKCQGIVGDPNFFPDPNGLIAINWNVIQSSPDNRRHVIHSDYVIPIEDPNGFLPYRIELEGGLEAVVCSVGDKLTATIDPKSLSSLASYTAFWLEQQHPADLNRDGIVNWRDYFN